MTSPKQVTPDVLVENAGTVFTFCPLTNRAKEWFDVDGYAAPAPGFYGNASVGAIRGPGLFDWDLSLIKRSPIFRDKVNSEFHASFYNLLNHTNFSGVSTAYGSGSFGQITSTLDPRILEFGLKAFF